MSDTGHPSGVVLLVIADVIAGFAVLASWAQYLNPVLTMIATCLAITYYLREYLRPLCRWLVKNNKQK